MCYRGKLVGGSSGINVMIWTRPSKEEVDIWSQFGNKGWDWDSLLPFFKKAENVTPGPEGVFPIATQAPGLDNVADGRGGPIQVGYNNFYSAVVKPFVESFVKIGAHVNGDPVSLLSLHSTPTHASF